jgi:hypothetical protein
MSAFVRSCNSLCLCHIRLLTSLRRNLRAAGGPESRASSPLVEARGPLSFSSPDCNSLLSPAFAVVLGTDLHLPRVAPSLDVEVMRKSRLGVRNSCVGFLFLLAGFFPTVGPAGGPEPLSASPD